MAFHAGWPYEPGHSLVWWLCCGMTPWDISGHSAGLSPHPQIYSESSEEWEFVQWLDERKGIKALADTVVYSTVWWYISTSSRMFGLLLCMSIE